MGRKLIWVVELIILGVIDTTRINKIIKPPTMIKNKENPIHEFLDIFEIIILVDIVSRIREKINFLEDFSELIVIKTIEIKIKIIRLFIFVIANWNFWFTKSML